MYAFARALAAGAVAAIAADVGIAGARIWRERVRADGVRFKVKSHIAECRGDSGAGGAKIEAAEEKSLAALGASA